MPDHTTIKVADLKGAQAKAAARVTERELFALVGVLEAARRSDLFVGRAKSKIESATEPLTDGDCHELLAMLSAAMWPLRSKLAEFDFGDGSW